MLSMPYLLNIQNNTDNRRLDPFYFLLFRLTNIKQIGQPKNKSY